MDKHKLYRQLNKGLQCFSFDKGNILLFRKHGQGAGACRHNRMQDTLLQAKVTTVMFPLSPWCSTGPPLPHTFLTHTHTSSRLSKHCNRYPDYPQRRALIMTLRCRDEEEEDGFWGGTGCVHRKVNQEKASVSTFIKSSRILPEC